MISVPPTSQNERSLNSLREAIIKLVQLKDAYIETVITNAPKVLELNCNARVVSIEEMLNNGVTQARENILKERDALEREASVAANKVREAEREVHGWLRVIVGDTEEMFRACHIDGRPYREFIPEPRSR